MAKQEVDIKKVELKVSVDCCDGCKKKVKKALNSIQGVLKTEIDPLQPKVTIQGNVDPQTLINKLQIKVGKQAQLWAYDNHHNSTTETKEISTATTVKTEHEISKSKHLEDPHETRAENAANTADGGSSCKTPLKNNDHDEDTNKNENPLPHHDLQTNCLRRPSTSKARTRAQYCYAVQPCTITLPHYAVHSYRMPPPLTSEQSYNQEQYYYETPPFQTSIPTPSTRVEDYFSDENTVGCYVM
ncbi:hypothetical protein LguiA_014425 [Lonicera macranthoides]